MAGEVRLEEKYERQGWPSLARPDLKPPAGWSLSLMTAVNRIHHHRLSPDGEQIAFIWERDGLADLYLMATAGGWPRRLTTERKAIPYWWDSPPQWSPDGRWLALAMNDQVYVTAAEGGAPLAVSDFFAAAAAPVWLPDSERLVVSVEHRETTRLALVDRQGEVYRTLPAGPGDDWDARPSPDGRRLLCTCRRLDNLNCWELHLLDLESGERRPLLTTAGRSKGWSGRWSPDGALIAFLSQESGFNDVWLTRPDGEGLRQLTHLGHDAADLAWSPDGRHLACIVNRGGAFDLALVEVESGERRFLAAGKGCYASPQWSPGGDALTVEYEEATRPPDVYRIEILSGQARQLTFSNPPGLARLEMVTPEQVSYTSLDGLGVPAFLYRPGRPNGMAIVYAHGGPTDQYVFGWDILAQYFVAKGYTYLAPNFRGSTGYGVAYEQANYDNWGMGDKQDCLHGADYLRQAHEVEAGGIAIYGPSYGGYMVACCLADDPQYRFACGVAKYGDANLLTSWAQCERNTRLYTEMQIGRPATNRAVYAAGTPITRVEKVQKPVLILHGLLDDVVPPQAAEGWAEALRRAGKEYEYKTYAGEPHGFLKRSTQLDAYGRIERFLDWHLMPDG